VTLAFPAAGYEVERSDGVVADLGADVGGVRAMTAIFAKLGVEQFNPDAATLIRTVVILIVLTGVVAATHQLPALAAGSPRTYAFLVLSGLATGASWWCYFRALHIGDAARWRAR